MQSLQSRQLLLTAAILVSSVTSQIYLPCDLSLVPGCSCWNPDRPIVRCENLNLGMFPQIPVNITNIHTLSLSHNHLTFMPENALLLTNTTAIVPFMFATGIQRLDVSHNSIVSLHRMAFRKSGPLLKELDMSHNNLSAVPYAFSKSGDAWRLITLDLSFNHITAIETGAFRNLGVLQKLSLQGNPIGIISANSWRNLLHLSVLDISVRSVRKRKIYLTSLPTGDLGSLQSLSVSGAEPQFLAVIQTWLVKLRRLKHVRLAAMKLNDTHITANCLSYLSNTLESLSLPDNRLRRIPALLLSNLTALRTLDLSGNRIRKFVLKPNQLVPVQIQNLNLSRNNIRKVNVGAITRLKQARMIDLSENQISGVNLTPARIDSLNVDVVFRFGGNPLLCDCANSGLRTLVDRQVQRSNGHLQLNEINNSLSCKASGRYAMQRMVDVPLSLFSCKQRRRGRKMGKKNKQKIINDPRVSKKTNSHTHRSGSLAKPITSIFYNRNIHAYQNSGTNVDIPKGILELLNPDPPAPGAS